MLLAVGRQPNTDGLGLDRARIRSDAPGCIEVDGHRRTCAKGVWAVRDCKGRGALTHISWNDHANVAAKLFERDPRRISDPIPCCALFIDPSLGCVVMTKAEAPASVEHVLRTQMSMQRGQTSTSSPRLKGTGCFPSTWWRWAVAR